MKYVEKVLRFIRWLLMKIFRLVRGSGSASFIKQVGQYEDSTLLATIGQLLLACDEEETV